MSVLTFRLILKVWKRGGINLVQTDIYYDMNSNTEPHYIFQDGLEISLIGESLQSNVNLAQIANAIQFSAFIFEQYYDEDSDTYSSRSYNLES